MQHGRRLHSQRENWYMQYTIRNIGLFSVVGDQKVKWAETERDTGTEVQIGGTKLEEIKRTAENIYLAFKRWF